MPSNKPIKSPAGYVPAFAVGFADAGGELAVVDTLKPLPVALTSSQPLPVSLDSQDPIAVEAYTPPAPAPLAGTIAATGLVGPFIPVAGRPVVLTLSGAWTGSVQVSRSIDGGTTRHPVTVAGLVWGRFTANACEPVWQEQETGAHLYLEITVASGSPAYRFAQ
jgi:hypothetical protein